MPVYALLGKTLNHSFSKGWFTSKFEREGLGDYRYINLETDDVSTIRSLVQRHELSGFNVTLPYKTAILPYLDDLSEEANAIGAVNVVKISSAGTLIGYNTDCIGFELTLIKWLKPCHTRALILGTGGASKAVAYILKKRGIDYQFVSRHGDGQHILRYDALTMLDVRNAPLIINTTPLGMYPDTLSKPDIPYEGVDKYHLLYDLVYNPPFTAFMEAGELYGAAVVNGYEMLLEQARAAWAIWQAPASSLQQRADQE
ncbi:MAG: shikimate dehydrogenase [Bacteroidia bacterium]|nr:shikimate dehydrogenase [Bacteroidia bacterium]